MTPKQVSKLVLAMAAAWPSLQVDEFRIEVWATMLSDIEPQTGIIALQTLMARNTFPPSISEFRKVSWEIENPNRIDEGAAWQMVNSAINEVLKNQQRTYAPLRTLPEKVQAICQDIGFSELVNGNPDVVRSNFIRLYKAAMDRERDMAVLPPSLRSNIARLSEGKEPEGLSDGFGIVVSGRGAR